MAFRISNTFLITSGVLFTAYTFGLVYVLCRFKGQLSQASKFFLKSFFAGFLIQLIAMIVSRILIETGKIKEESDKNMITLIFDLCYASNQYFSYVFAYVIKITYTLFLTANI